ncbi:MAG: beta-galactosidase [Anaerolineales bacterium]|nr:beta-galactosidase [Anaerolineales bacterium]
MFYFGADYYPEHWPETRWFEDARLMAEAGFNIVRMAEFAWSFMEPEDGKFEFAWLDRAIETLAAQDIHVVLGTPTASPPPWLMAKQEDLFLVREDGVRATYGLRREYCINNPLYHQHTERIVTKMAEHFANHSDVIGWQIDNEFGNRCYCEICRKGFLGWLQKRYQSLEEVNDVWGTAFWSHIYTDWSQIPVPLKREVAHNPGLHLDYKRFMSDSFRQYQKLQIDIIRQQTEEQFITHNLMGFGFDQLNYYDNAEDLDFVSWDNYKRMQWDMNAAIDPSSAALSADTMRGLKKKNFWVMEQQSGGGGWDIVAIPPKPGELRLWTYQSVAHGADAILYFRWRTCRTGTEQYWHGVLDHYGIPGRRYEEVSHVGMELQIIGKAIHGSQVRAPVAIMQSYDTRFAFQVQPTNPRFGYEAHIHDFYRAFFHHNIPVDIVSEKDELEGYKLVLVPAMYVLTEETVSNLERFVDSGGLLVFTPRTGVKDETNKVVNMKLPGLVTKLAGVEVEEYVSMPEDEDNQVNFELLNLKGMFPVSVWADVLKPTTAQIVARYGSDYYAGCAAVTINEFESGEVIYIGTMGDEAFYGYVVEWLLELSGLEPFLYTPGGVEVAERWQGDQRILFILNHTAEEVVVHLPFGMTNLLTNEGIEESVPLAPFDLCVLGA